MLNRNGAHCMELITKATNAKSCLVTIAQFVVHQIVLFLLAKHWLQRPKTRSIDSLIWA